MRRLAAALAFALALASPAFGGAINDEFNRPDNSDLGPEWTPQRGGDTGGRLVNQRVRSSALENGSEESYGGQLTGDQFARITITTFTGAGYGDAGVFVRAAVPPERTFVVCSALKNDPNTTAISMRQQGASVTLATESSTVWVNGDVLELSAAGSTYTCKRNGQAVLTMTDATLTQGRVGFRVREDADLSNTEIDSFIGGDIGQGVLEATWTEPTTNTDGSALTDLATYKIYYSSPTINPCPGTQFYTMPAPLSTPPLNSTQRFVMTGLLAGQPYRAMVTAVDTTGAESACSESADAVARSIGPNAITNTLVH